MFSGGAKVLRLRDESNAIFWDLECRRRDPRQMVSAVKEGLKTTDPI
jgi:hypothetical protein